MAENMTKTIEKTIKALSGDQEYTADEAAKLIGFSAKTHPSIKLNEIKLEMAMRKSSHRLRKRTKVGNATWWKLIPKVSVDE